MTGKTPLQPAISASNRNARLRRSMGVSIATGYVETGGCQMAWQQLSPREALQPIVCLHDAGSGSREFRPLHQHIPPSCSLLLIDWPGHGRSETPTAYNRPQSRSNFTVEASLANLHLVLRHLTAPAGNHQSLPTLLASGFASAVAMRYAAAHPGKLNGIILCQPAGLLPPSPRNSPHHVSQSSTARRTFPKWIAKLSNPRAQGQARRIEVLRAVMNNHLAQAALSLSEGQRTLDAALRKVVCPILFALSRDSQSFPLERGLAFLDPLLQASPQHKLTVFDGSFHPLWEDTERFAQAVHAFAQAQLPIALHRHSWVLTAVDWPARNLNLWKCIHPDCPEERILPTGQDANQSAEPSLTGFQ